MLAFMLVSTTSLKIQEKKEEQDGRLYVAMSKLYEREVR